MKISTRFALAASALALAIAPLAAAETPRLFADSRLVQQDRISVEVVGAGPDLVLIPGLASSRETWRATAQRLRGRYRLHLVNVNGFAGAPAGANAQGPVLVPVAEAFDAYVRGAHLSPATFIGHSMGGTITLWLAEHHPDDVRRALVVDALPIFGMVMLPPGFTPEQAHGLAEGIRARSAAMPPAARDQMIASMVTGPADRKMVSAWGADSDPSVTARAMADDVELDLRPDLSKIHAPITLLYPDNAGVGAPAGAMDGLYPAAYRAAPSVKTQRIDKSLHFIMLDQPGAFARVLDAFLASRPPTGS